MANQIWLGNAGAIAQITSITIGGTPGSGNTYTVTIGFGSGKSVTYIATVSDTNTTIAANLVALLANCLFPEFLEIAWTNPSASVIYATAQTAGNSFTFSTTPTGSGTPTMNTATVTASSSPYDGSVAANWSTGSLPITGDNFYFQGSNVPILFGLSALAGITPANVYFDASYTAPCGLPVYNANGYREYRPRYLQFSGVSGGIFIGRGQGNGSGKIQLDMQSGNFTATVYKAAATSEPGQPSVIFKGGNSASSVNVLKGNTGIALLAGETANIPTLNIDYVTNQTSDAQVTVGPGATLNNVTMAGGTLTALCAVPNIVMEGAKATVQAGNMTSCVLNNSGPNGPPSILNYQPPAAQTITNYSIGKNCTLDCSGTLQTVTLTGNGAGPTTGTIYAGAEINAPAGNVVFTNPFSIPDGQPSDITLNVGNNRTVKVI